jgi:hypothetical protein
VHFYQIYARVGRQVVQANEYEDIEIAFTLSRKRITGAGYRLYRNLDPILHQHFSQTDLANYVQQENALVAHRIFRLHGSLLDSISGARGGLSGSFLAMNALSVLSHGCHERGVMPDACVQPIN